MSESIRQSRLPDQPRPFLRVRQSVRYTPLCRRNKMSPRCFYPRHRSPPDAKPVVRTWFSFVLPLLIEKIQVRCNQFPAIPQGSPIGKVQFNKFKNVAQKSTPLMVWGYKSSIWLCRAPASLCPLGLGYNLLWELGRR